MRVTSCLKKWAAAKSKGTVTRVLSMAEYISIFCPWMKYFRILSPFFGIFLSFASIKVDITEAAPGDRAFYAIKF